MPAWLVDALRSPESSALGMLSTLLLFILGFVRKAQRMAKEDEKAMLAVPPTQLAPATDSSLRERVEQLEFDLGRARFAYGELRDKLEEARRELNEIARDQAQTANALKLERAAHLETRSALDDARHLARQARSHAERLAAELHERVRATESGYTRLPDMRAPEQISEEDASPTPRPRGRR